MKKFKVIIDTDPGVDDAGCLVFALADKSLDIKLISTVKGNVDVEMATRNTLHILDKFGCNIPVAKGEAQAIARKNTPLALEIHSAEGLGGYIPPKETISKVIKEDAVSAMYKIIMDGDGDIIPIVLGPHTNIAKMISLHPEVVKKIPKIIFMGASPFGLVGFKDHISFNISSDPEAFKIVVDSKIPLVMLPSNMGREKAYFTEEYTRALKDKNEVGAFLFEMFDAYWEHGYPDKRIATNDTCAYMYLIHPELFTTERINIDVNITDCPGKTIVHYDPYGHVELTVAVERQKFLKIIDEKMDEFNGFKFKM